MPSEEVDHEPVPIVFQVNFDENRNALIKTHSSFYQ